MQFFTVSALLSLMRVSLVDGFAYAPNFITKIIQKQTAIEPQGLLDIQSDDDDGKESSQTEDSNDAPSNKKPEKRVVTRFPPEPNGYLHLGHAKAVCFNFAVARMFGGICNMRLDDTNPSKEDEEYVESILNDVLWIQSGLYNPNDASHPWDGDVKKTSGYFDQIYDCAVALVKQGDAYVDSLSADEVREYRGTLTVPGKDSPYRSRSVDENLELFQGMKGGRFAEGEHILRAKIDMGSPNLNMRDPTLYRIKHESHQETGDAWCIYPMYDFSHPIADALEGITHSLCTLEFEDHRPFYDWTVAKLVPTGCISAQPQQIEFSRLNVKSTVLSKRKLIQLVEKGVVNGWDDPRMPTMSGMRRRGVPPSALRVFCERVGISKAESNMDALVLEDCVREEMDDACRRAFAVLKPLKVTITNWGEDGIEDFQVPRHPKRKDMGDRIIPFGRNIFIERSDFFDLDGPEGKATNGGLPAGFKRLLPNGMVRLRFAYVIQCDEVVRNPDSGEVLELRCKYLPETRAGVTPEGMSRVKGIIHWVEESTAQKCKVNQYDRLFLTEEPGKESGDFLKDVNPRSLEVLSDVVVEKSVAVDALEAIYERKVSSVPLSALAYQFERSGYFALDEASKREKLVFNRVVTLRDTWAAPKEKGKGGGRSRGAGKGQAKKKAATNTVVEDVRRVAFRAVSILSAELHPEANNLVVCKVDCGDTVGSDKLAASEPRTVVAGLAGKIEIEDLIGRKVVAVTNLKPSRMRGIESTAMLLAASNEREEESTVELLCVPDSVPNGELICFEGKETSQPDGMLKSKGALKAWGRAKAGLKANELGEVMFKDVDGGFRMMTSSGPVKTSSLKDVPIQ